MQEFTLRHYLGEIYLQAQFAMQAAGALNESIRRPSAITSTFAPAQSILTAAAQISKLLWPTTHNMKRERAEFATERGAQLRALLEPSELLNDRSVRNAVEHFDEHLDKLLMADEAASIADMNMGPVGFFPIVGLTWMRNLDPETFTISVLDVGVSLQDLIFAINDVGKKAKAEDDRIRAAGPRPLQTAPTSETEDD